MGAEDIKMPCRFWPHQVNNTNASYFQLSQTNNVWMPEGIHCPDGQILDINFAVTGIIPTDINATPNGKLRVFWVTASTDTASNVEFLHLIKAPTPETDSLDFTGAFTGLQDTSAGQYQMNKTDISLSGIAADLVSENWLHGVLRRDARPSNANDTLAAAIVIIAAVFVADV